MLSSPQAPIAMTRPTTPTSSSKIPTSLPALLHLTTFIIILSTLSRTIGAFTVEQLKGTPLTSHSGPTNALYGHEQFADEDGEQKRSKRAGFFGQGPGFNNNNNNGWGFNNGGFNNNNNNNNGWGGLLMSSEPLNDYLKMWVVSEHNQYRKMVPATDMRMMYWSDELAASAQRHANTCDFRHSRNRVNIGENIWAAPYANYSDAVTRWWDEVNNPRCGCNHAYKHCCGHYIQVVWAQTNLIGCGYARCRDVLGVLGMGMRAVLVCHYNPQGNKVYFGVPTPIAVPAFKWANNNAQRCSECPPDAPACHEGLCYMPLNYEKGAHNNGNGTQTTSNDNNQQKLAKGVKGGNRKATDKALEQNTVVEP